MKIQIFTTGQKWHVWDDDFFVYDYYTAGVNFLKRFYDKFRFKKTNVRDFLTFDFHRCGVKQVKTHHKGAEPGDVCIILGPWRDHLDYLIPEECPIIMVDTHRSYSETTTKKQNVKVMSALTPHIPNDDLSRPDAMYCPRPYKVITITKDMLFNNTVKRHKSIGVFIDRKLYNTYRHFFTNHYQMSMSHRPTSIPDCRFAVVSKEETYIAALGAGCSVLVPWVEFDLKYNYVHAHDSHTRFISNKDLDENIVRALTNPSAEIKRLNLLKENLREYLCPAQAAEFRLITELRELINEVKNG